MFLSLLVGFWFQGWAILRPATLFILGLFGAISVAVGYSLTKAELKSKG
ncbi:MAG: hypothetical protein SXQ77_07485 [Halobacteria archaeon]|nr:hypothetical protein [Halobacteria archaeon]